MHFLLDMPRRHKLVLGLPFACCASFGCSALRSVRHRQCGLRPMVYYMCAVNWDRGTRSDSLHGTNRRHREPILAPNDAGGWARIGTVAGYFGTVFCFFQLMNRHDDSSPVTSQRHHVRRHSVACIDLRLNAPRVTQSTNPRSSKSLKAREAVSLAMLQRSATRRTDRPIRPLLLPS